MIALVTGGGSGIGRAASIELARTMTVVVADYRFDQAEATALFIRQSGGNAFAFEADVSSGDSVAQLYRATKREVGTVDALFNNAGISSRSSILDMTEQEWNDVLKTHVKGTYLCSRIFLPDMCAQRKGFIVNMSSDYAAIGKADGSAYAAAKTAILALTKSLSVEFSAHNIRINAVGPGPIDTPLLRYGKDREQWERFIEGRNSMIPIGRIGIPEDVAQTVSFLCSDRSRALNGQLIHINGGRLMN